MTLTQSLVYLGLALVVAPPDGRSRHDDETGRFGGHASVACKVSPRLARRSQEGPNTIGIWCNWQHDWFWSS